MNSVLKRSFSDTDGACFALHRRLGHCALLSRASVNCGTYGCGFYKPADCHDYIRIDRPDGVLLVPEEDYFAKRW